MSSLKIGIEEYKLDTFDEVKEDGIEWRLILLDSHGRMYATSYCSNKQQNFIVQTKFDITEHEVKNASVAAFCFLSVILDS